MMTSWSRGGPGSREPGRWACENLSTWSLLLIAFDLRPNELVAPEWIHQTIFNIEAKVPQGAKREDFRDMMQNMLKDRFGLKQHRESKELPGYELVVAKGGPKLKDAAPEPPGGIPGGVGRSTGPGEPLGPDGFPIMPPGQPGTIMMPDRAVSQWVRTTMDRVARSLTSHVGKPVVNATGLTGVYDVTLKWMTQPLRAAPEAEPPQPAPAGPSIFTAVQEQLGLKLESKKIKVDVLVVDDIKKVPTEN